MKMINLPKETLEHVVFLNKIRIKLFLEPERRVMKIF